MNEIVYLAAVRMYNCQSHKDTIYEFSPDKVNVIFGDNSVGKSVFFKMLKASINPKSLQEKDRVDLIRRKEEFAQIHYLFSDNSNAICRVYKKGIIFQYQESPQDKPIVTNEPHEKFLEKLNILMDVNSGFTTNIIDGDNDRLLVNSNLKSNYYFLRLIVYNEDIENLMEKIPVKMADAQKLRETLVSKLNYVNQRLEVISYVDPDLLQEKVLKMESGTDVLYKGIDIYKFLLNLEASFTEKKDFNYLLSKTEILQKCVKISETLDNLHPVRQFKIETLNLCEKGLGVFKTMELLESLELPDTKKMELNKLLLNCIEVLQCLNNIIAVDETKDYTIPIRIIDIMLAILENLENIKLTKEKDYVEKENLLEKVVVLTDLCEKITFLQETAQNKAIAEKEYFEVLDKIKGQNAVVNCPVYGEVIFDEHNCTPVQ